MMKIGFIGLGLLGTPIALNLAEAGHDLYVYNRTASKAEPLKKKGAKVCGTVAELAAQAEVIFSIVSDDLALKNITEGKEGMVENAKPGLLHISMSTILPATASELASLHAQHGQTYLSAPVFGRPEAAAARKMNFVLSGDEAARKKAEPLVRDAGAAGVWDFGDNILAANTVKLCGNFLIASAVEAIGESTNLAKKAGVDLLQMWSMFNQTLFNAPVYHNYSKIVLEQKFQPASFTMRLGLKDLNLVLQQAGELGQSMPLAELIRGHMQKLISAGQSETDWSALAIATEVEE